MWVHREGDVIFVDSRRLDYHPSIFYAWANELDRSLEEAADHWMHVYKPVAGDVVIDIGAGKGEDTIAFSRAVGPVGRVIAIEAHPDTFRCLRFFCEWNRLDNVTAIHCAITGRSGPVTIESTGDWQSNRIASSGVTARGFTLDEIVQRENLTRIHLLKMNIEGAEAQAIQGMDRSLSITRALCISCHDFRGFRTKAIVQEAVERAGFRIVPRDRDPRPYVADQVNAVHST
jgi:FkbM family methyltransferase